MSWILTESICLESKSIKRTERRKRTSPAATATFDWAKQQPIDSSTVQKYNYYLITEDNKEFELSKEDFITIRDQLNKINQQDIEFLRYIREHLEFKPGTEAFEDAKSDFYGRN